MYPETDIPQILITDASLREIAGMLPVPWKEKVQSYVDRYSLSPDLSLQLYDSGDAPIFERMAAELKLDRSVIASVLVEIPARLAREGVDESRMSESLLTDVLRAMERGEFAKEAAVNVLRAVGKGEAQDVQDAVKRLGITGLGEDELKEIIDRVVQKHDALIKEKGERSFSVLMGEVMKSARGRVDGETVSRLLRERISASTAVAQG